MDITTDKGDTMAQVATVTAIYEAIKKVDPEGTAGPRGAKVAAKLMKELGPEFREVINAFDAAKHLKAYASQQKKYHEAIIRPALAPAVIGLIEGRPAIKLTPSHTSYIDMEMLRTAFPEAYEKCLRRTDYDYLTVV